MFIITSCAKEFCVRGKFLSETVPYGTPTFHEVALMLREALPHNSIRINTANKKYQAVISWTAWYFFPASLQLVSLFYGYFPGCGIPFLYRFITLSGALRRPVFASPAPHACLPAFSGCSLPDALLRR
jgi:hypothetical protein